MGGAITTVFRNIDGEVLSQILSTSNFGDFVRDEAFFKKDKAYLTKWLLQPDGYKKVFRIAPYWYGIVVLDWQKDVILTCNGYDNLSWHFQNGFPGQLSPSRLGRDEYGNCIINDFSPFRREEYTESLEGYTNLMNKLVALDFTIDDKAWKKFIKERESS